jgi:uncharacterized protein YndB with AHSA1/START domain
VIRKQVLLRCPPERAFALFTEEISAWWPASRRHTGDPESAIRLLPEGRFWEESRDGRAVELGRVTAWEPPARLVLDFYPGTDAEHPTEVEVRFHASPGGTQVVLEHRPTPASEGLWERGAPAYQRSWDVVLEALAGTVAA